jgi:MFS family permease
MAEGLFAEVVSACSGGAVLTGWALYLGAGPLLIGLVMALPQIAQLFQLPAAWTTSRLGSRRAAVVLVAVQRQVTLPLVMLPFLHLPSAMSQAVLLGVTALSAILGVFGNNAWVSWMGDLVPRRIRGRYFGRRTALLTAGGALASAVAGLLLDGARRYGLVGDGLGLLQALACASGAVTTLLMARQHEGRTSRQVEKVCSFGFNQALAPLRDRSVRGFVAYLLAWNLATGIAGGFFSLFMLGDLRMGFTLVAIQGVGVAVVRMLTAPAWGILMDRVGARPVLVACSFGISVIPLIWLFPTPTCLWPLAIDSLLTGILWSGYNLAAFNLPLAISQRASRPFYLALFATVGGAASALAMAAAAILVRLLPEHMTMLGLHLGRLQQLFALSAVLRLGASFIALGMKHASGRDVLVVVRAAIFAVPGFHGQLARVRRSILEAVRW